ncbi:MAG TPA: hypothetical protein DEP35_00190 [Deltaproteobacteria bacterium]|jgi:hypothetical protein|nr:hypothetical protein [Deltaproteobacteria bacterium]
MSASAAFESTCTQLEQVTSFDSLSARGTVRLALKSAGLDAREVTTAQMIVVLKRVLPAELKVRGVKNAEEVCSVIASRIVADGATSSSQPRDSVEEVFRRLGGS